MDPVSLQSANLGVVRPAIALQSDLAAVLQEGRVLAGEVLQTLDGRTLLIGIGRHRVPAKSQVELQQGHRFLFQVEGQGESLTLRVLDDRGFREPALLAALRGALGHDEPLGRLLEVLTRALRASGGHESLVARLEGHLARADGDGAALAARLASGGLGYEARLAVAAALSLPSGEALALGRELEAWLGGRLVDGLGGAFGANAESLLADLRRELGALLGVRPGSPEAEALFARALARAAGSESVGELSHWLRAALARVLGDPARARGLANLHAAHLPALGRGLETILLRRLLELPARAPAELVRAQLDAALGLGADDLKALLLRAAAAWSGKGTTAAREALAHALTGMEAEQLLNVARTQAGEALHWSVPFADGDRWTTLHLYAQRREGSGAGDVGEDAGWRFEFAVELSNTGPVRADLLARPGSLVVGVRVASEELAAHLSKDLETVRERLAAGGRRVELCVSAASAESLRPGPRGVDIHYLREHRLMDLCA